MWTKPIPLSTWLRELRIWRALKELAFREWQVFSSGQEVEDLVRKVELAAAPEGLVLCDACSSIVRPRGDYYSIHYPSLVAAKLCPRSWPPAVLDTTRSDS